MVHHGVVDRAQEHGDGRCSQVTAENHPVKDGRFRISIRDCVVDDYLSKQQTNRRDQMRVDVDSFVVKVAQRLGACQPRIRRWSIA